ncbi:hypothetical protein D9M68_556390 [compost metagenome]
MIFPMVCDAGNSWQYRAGLKFLPITTGVPSGNAGLFICARVLSSDITQPTPAMATAIAPFSAMAPAEPRAIPFTTPPMPEIGTVTFAFSATGVFAEVGPSQPLRSASSRRSEVVREGM